MDPSDVEVSRYFPRSSTKSMTEAKTTTVILVCIYNKNSTIITHDILYNVFSTYGKIFRILIFDKLKVWKAFIEFSTVEEAMEAKRNLNDYILFNDGTRMNIYFSELQTIKFQNNNSGGVDYTQNEGGISDLKDDLIPTQVSSPGQQSPGSSPLAGRDSASPEPRASKENNGYAQFDNRPIPTLQQSQSASGQLRWEPQPDIEETEEEFLRSVNAQVREKDSSQFDTSRSDIDDFGKDDINRLLANVFPASRSTQYEKARSQGLNLNAPAFSVPGVHGGMQSSMNPNMPMQPSIQTSMQQPTYQNSMQNTSPYWPQPPPKDLTPAPPGLNNFPGYMQEPTHHIHQQQKLMRMHNSMTHIPLRSPNLTSNATFTDLPLPSSMTSGPSPGPIGLIPRHATFNELPKFSEKPNIPQFGSGTNLPNPKPVSPAPFGALGGMGQGGMISQPLNKPMLNPRFGSQPELPLASELSKFKLKDLSSQNVQDLIERDLLLRNMMNNLQSQDGDLMSQSSGLITDLNDMKRYSNVLNSLAQDHANIDLNDLSQLNKGALDQIYQDLSNLLGKSVENKECAVLYVKGLEHKDIKVQMLFNIFSNFGNIKKIIFIRRQAAALIEYETVEYATKAKDYLNNIVFMGKPLRIYYSFHPIINLKNKKNGNSTAEEIFIGTAKTSRFKKTKSISMNPPSSTLHISNLVKEMCVEEIMKQGFGPYGRIEAIQFKFMDNNRNMCLIKMASMEESLNAMAYLHDNELGGRPMQISFTKSKI